MKPQLSRRNSWNSAIGLGLVGFLCLCILAEGKPVQARPEVKEPVSGSMLLGGANEPISGSVLWGGRTLNFLVNQEQLSLELRRQDGSQYRCILPANQALVVYLSKPLRDLGSASLASMSELFGIMAAMLEDSSIAETSEIIEVLQALQ